jgi:hypothetical protein
MLWNDRARRPVLRGACSGGQRTHGDDRACADEGSRDSECILLHVSPTPRSIRTVVSLNVIAIRAYTFPGQQILNNIKDTHSIAQTSQHSSSAHYSGSHTCGLTSRRFAPLNHEGSRSMSRRSSLRTLALAAAGVSLTAALAVPAVGAATEAVASPAGYATDWGPYGPYGPPHPHDWDNHPEWGPGWNNGYPSAGWYPPAGWVPPPDWNPPAGWYPPPGWAPPPDWVGPCAGPLFDLFHPMRCA